MKSEKNILNFLLMSKETVTIIKQALELAIKSKNESRYEWEELPPLSGPEKVSFALSTLRPDKLKLWINRASSVNWGKNILARIFPKSENPEDYHSGDGVIRLDEHPVQVLGWEDKDRMVKEGVSLGLSEGWIDRGFESEARRKGLDLEFHFFAHPPIIKQEDTERLETHHED